MAGGQFATWNGAGAALQHLAFRPTIHPLGPAAAVRVAFAAVERPMTDLLEVVPLARDRNDLLAANDVYEVEADADPAPPRVARSRVEPGRACALSRPRPEAMAGAAALRFAWCLMDLERPLEAIAYFDRAIAIGAAATRSEATYGKSLAYLRKGLTDEAAVAATEAPQTLRRSAELTTGILTQRALAFYKERRFTETLLTLDERAKFLPEQNDLMLMRGWSYFELGRFDDAEQVFRAVMKTGYSTEAARGLSAIEERTKQVHSE